jgi:hypothetical protein
MDALKWITKTCVPITCIPSWLIRAAYLYSAPEAYCPVNQDFINALWIVVPVLSTITQVLIGL